MIFKIVNFYQIFKLLQISILKHPNVTPVFKKGYCGSKENYCPVSILPVMSNIFEQLLCKQPKCLQIKIFQNISAALEKVLVHNIP